MKGKDSSLLIKIVTRILNIMHILLKQQHQDKHKSTRKWYLILTVKHQITVKRTKEREKNFFLHS